MLLLHAPDRGVMGVLHAHDFGRVLLLHAPDKCSMLLLDTIQFGPRFSQLRFQKAHAVL